MCEGSHWPHPSGIPTKRKGSGESEIPNDSLRDYALPIDYLRYYRLLNEGPHLHYLICDLTERSPVPRLVLSILTGYISGLQYSGASYPLHYRRHPYIQEKNERHLHLVCCINYSLPNSCQPNILGSICSSCTSSFDCPMQMVELADKSDLEDLTR